MKFFMFLLVFVFIFDSGICRHETSRKRTNATSKDTNTFEYFTKHNQRHDITIPVTVHLDKALTYNLSKEYKSRSREKVKNMFRTILRNVETLFRRPSLNQTVRFVLLDVRFLKNTTKKIENENVSKYLNRYCQWQGEKKEEKRKWYYSVLFTGLDVFYYGKNNKQVRSSTGRSYQNGICSTKNSCTILEWRRTNIDLKLAHEIGHSMGISHDGAPHNHCRGDHHIMAPKYFRQNPAKTWSACSKRNLQRFLTSRFSWCIRPGSRNQI